MEVSRLISYDKWPQIAILLNLKWTQIDNQHLPSALLNTQKIIYDMLRLWRKTHTCRQNALVELSDTLSDNEPIVAERVRAMATIRH